MQGRALARSSGIGSAGMACSGRFFGLRTSGISGRFASRGISDGDCENLVGFFVRRLGRCATMVQVIEMEGYDGFCLHVRLVLGYTRAPRH